LLRGQPASAFTPFSRAEVQNPRNNFQPQEILDIQDKHNRHLQTISGQEFSALNAAITAQFKWPYLKAQDCPIGPSSLVKFSRPEVSGPSRVGSTIQCLPASMMPGSYTVRNEVDSRG
jgi:hypothetical protein